jgi:hypothetical protein
MQIKMKGFLILSARAWQFGFGARNGQNGKISAGSRF